MKKLMELVPALFCFLYFERVAYLVSSFDDPSMDLVPKLALRSAPVVGFLLATLLFLNWDAFRRRFSRFIRSMLVVLATAVFIGVFATISFCFRSTTGSTLPSYFVFLFVAVSSLSWLPLTLAVAASYGVPLWAWEGRNNPDHMTQRVGRAIFRHRLGILRIFAVAIGIGAALLEWDHWRKSPADPSWVCVATQNRHFRLITGLAPDGTEVVIAHAFRHEDPHALSDIVSLDARNGHVRWERGAPSAFTAVIDRDRNVVYAGDGGIVAKVDGDDGRVLWQQRVAETNIIAVGLFPPVADKVGQIWISGNKQYRNNESYRFLALLEAGDGKVRWEKTQPPAEIGALDPAEIFPLEGGDAFSALPPYPYGFGGTRAWIMQRLSGKTGDVLWEVDPPSDTSDNSANVHWLVDEAHGQVVVYSGTWSRQGVKLINLVAYDLFTGKEKWRAVNTAPTNGLGPGIVTLSFDGQSNLLLWYSAAEFNQSWLARWTQSNLLILFGILGHGREYQDRNFRIVLSITDGRILDCQEFGRNERLFAVLSGAGTGPPGAAILQEGEAEHSQEPWRAVLLDRGALPVPGGVPLFTRQPRGSDRRSTFDGDAVVTPSGKFVNCDFNNGWQIKAW